jgi:hypothetical protein
VKLIKVRNRNDGHEYQFPEDKWELLDKEKPETWRDMTQHCWSEGIHPDEWYFHDCRVLTASVGYRLQKVRLYSDEGRSPRHMQWAFIIEENID